MIALHTLQELVWVSVSNQVVIIKPIKLTGPAQTSLQLNRDSRLSLQFTHITRSSGSTTYPQSVWDGIRLFLMVKRWSDQIYKFGNVAVYTQISVSQDRTLMAHWFPGLQEEEGRAMKRGMDRREGGSQFTVHQQINGAVHLNFPCRQIYHKHKNFLLLALLFFWFYHRAAEKNRARVGMCIWCRLGSMILTAWFVWVGGGS